MKKLFSVLLALLFCMSAAADNFIINHGEQIKLFSPRSNGKDTERADLLFGQDYQEVFGEYLVHTNRIEEAKVIVCTYDNPELKKYAKIRGVNFNSLIGQKESFVLKVHNGGKQLFVVGSDDRGTAFGLMTISRMWGVSPFRWWADAPALPRTSFELGVAFEKLYSPSIPTRTLVLNGAQLEDNYLQDLLLRLRVSGITNEKQATDDKTPGVFRWNLEPAIQPYLGLSLALDHPERIRLEALRANKFGHNKEWQLHWGHQLGGELQILLFFDMAWNLDAYRDPYAVDKLEDLHYTQMSGLENNWSRIWNDFFDLTMMLHPDEPLSLEAIRRGIGESQSLGLQLSLDLSEKVVPAAYTNAFFRTVEYPLNMTSAQMQRLCNMQLVKHDMGKPWSVDDCRQRMQLLISELPNLVAPKWHQIMGGMPMPALLLGRSLMRVDGYRESQLEVGSNDPLPSDERTALLYRSDRAIGTYVEPFEPLRIPLNYQDETIHLSISLLPVKTYGKSIRCMVSVDKGETRLIEISQDKFPEVQQLFNLEFAVDPTIEEHTVVFRTMSDGVYVQRVWLNDMNL